MSKKVNPNDAPPGYHAVRAEYCQGCSFHKPDVGCQININPDLSRFNCTANDRQDGCCVSFVENPAPLTKLEREALTELRSIRQQVSDLILKIEAKEPPCQT